MSLEFRGFVAEGAFDAFAQLEFGAGQGAFEIGKTFPSQVFQFWEKSLELFNTLGEVVNR